MDNRNEHTDTERVCENCGHTYDDVVCENCGYGPCWAMLPAEIQADLDTIKRGEAAATDLEISLMYMTMADYAF